MDRQQLTIGLSAGGHTSSVDFCASDINHSFSLILDPAAMQSYTYEAMDSPNHLWSVESNNHSLSIKKHDVLRAQILLKTHEIVTVPRWSPDSKFVFYVTKENKWTLRPIFECLDDAYDINVYSIETGTSSQVGRVCAGFPYESIRWLYQPT